ncbi:MAG: DUF4011 domain-containing protein [Planctomycetota bacterium]
MDDQDNTAKPTSDQDGQPEGPSVALRVEHTPVVGFAGQQHGIPLIESIEVESAGNAPLRDIELSAHVTSGVASPWATQIDSIPGGSTHRVYPVEIALASEPLAQQTERERTELLVEARLDGAVVAARRSPLDVLAADEWGGMGVLPELLASFVLPNHPAIEPILRRANELVHEISGVPGLDGYQSRDPKRAARIAEAGYVALLERGIGYINPPASFESAGQRVRLADRVLGAGLGTCLDLSLLLASVWEQSGLHPLLVVFEDHALPAVWTRPEHFADAVLDSGLSIRKRAELDEVVLVESTMLTKGDAGTFAAARTKAFDRLANEPGSVSVIDVRAARKIGVRPLPVRVDRTEPDDHAEPGTVRYTLAPDPLPPAVPEVNPLPESEPPAPNHTHEPDRLGRWKRRLLDLSLRNRLINFRMTRRTIPLLVADPGAIEDRLAAGRSVELVPRPEHLPDNDIDPDGVSARDAFLNAQLAAGGVFADLSPAESERRSIELFRDARASLDETGANLLHLALGTLVWRESPGAEPREAPLVLLPVRLERPGGGRPLRITLSEEPPRANDALLEKLRLEFNIDDPSLAELPEDDRGIDLTLILRRYREAIKRIDGWEIRDTARLGMFSFSRFLMWRDIAARSDDLRKSDLVRRLVDADTETDTDTDDQASLSLDSTPSTDVAALESPLLTRDADASQIAAVTAAASGETFVLQGPPGTGKSQTIANLIADALGRGERVLFVAEKRAALSVVRRRLERDGLGPFCLELHSNRSSKSEVLEQLREPLELAGLEPPAQRDSTVERLTKARARLDAVVREINAPTATGESIRDVIARLTELGEEPVASLDIGEPADTDAAGLVELRERVVALADAAAVVTSDERSLMAHALTGIGVREFSFALPDAARDAIDETATRLAELERAANKWLLAIGADPSLEAIAKPSANDIRWRADAGELLDRCPGTTAGLLDAQDWADLRSELDQWLGRGRERDTRRAQLFERYDRAVLELDLATLNAQAKRAANQSGLGRWWTMRPVRTALRNVSLGRAPKADQAAADIELARAVVEETHALATAVEPASVFGRRWSKGEADWDVLSAMLRWADDARKVMAGAGPHHASAELPARVRAAALGETDAPADYTAALRLTIDEYERSRAALGQLLDVDWSVVCGDKDELDHFGRLGATLAGWRRSLSELSDWCVWQSKRKDAQVAGLQGLVDQLEAGSAQPDDIGAIFERSFGQRWLRVTADRSEAVRGFSARAHAQAIRRFAALDEELLDLNRTLVRARLAAEIPPPTSNPSPHSEIGILRRQFELKRRQLPIRQLIERIPGTLARLKPCFLMSPLSIAQYLDPALPPFDVVVFDEASQIPPWEAIGAIARGSRVVVVGDSKQLPPTSFFEKAEPEDDETADEAQELESILQECVASGVPTRRLLWHYRSRHDSLIAFSNESYYDNALRTFPAPAEPGEHLGVSFRNVEGAYDRGATRTNRAEAEAVVDELAALLLEGRYTVGVVSFNIAQQILVEDIFDHRCRKSPELDAARTKSESTDEPAFIKNLESVQGDERDVILFSVTYGPDHANKMTMNFGPLNRDGGERRLNVAVTRARRRVVAFASFEPDRIDPARTNAVGVRHLRRFLEFARSGKQPATPADTVDTGPIESAVRDELLARGHDVAERVGTGASRIALAVRDPADPTCFILGIEFDGPAYADAESATDRDRIRPAVLGGLGWTLYRVWSVEWRLNRESVLRSLERAIADARRAATRAHDNDQPDNTQPQAALQSEAEPETVTDEPNAIASSAGLAEPPQHTASVYKPWFPTSLIGDRDMLMDEQHQRPALDTLIEIVAAEAPITRPLATRRLAEGFGVERLIKSVRDHCEHIIDHAVAKHKIAQFDDALWPAKTDATIENPRTPGETPASRRSLEDISLAERVAAVRTVLQEQVALPDEELAKHAARLLGTHRLTDKTAPLIEQAIKRYRDEAPE